MTQELHRLIDNGAPQPVINERIAGLIEKGNSNQARIEALVGTITSDHEKRLRYLERTMAWALGGIGVISAVLMLASKIWK